MKIIIDSNVWVSFLLGFQKSLIHDVLSNEHIDVFVCPQLLHEIQDVASRPKILSRIKEFDIEQLLRLIKVYCINTKISNRVNVAIRDTKDLYLLSLAETVKADYIVSGDKDLLVLQEYKQTRILSPAQFKLIS
ncbi:MAG: putative toxin-antitoxin system toxin component, PIN family [Paludibacteraceae bacterium]|nr:putative toxin-antitoxin system toxin component, PIN family [Paludibacteraceae bacterium]